MEHRALGQTGIQISPVSLGCWAIGGSWGSVDDAASMEALHAAVDQGVNFFDTADVYGDGLSERLLGQLLRERRGETLYVATKAGRQLAPHSAEGYNATNLRRFVNSSLKNLGVERLDLLQLHCPPTDVYYRPEVFQALDALVSEGKVKHYGVSVERVEEGLKALEYPGVATVQIIYNAFRQRPAERFFPLAKERGVGVIVRVPLASGLLTGKFTAKSQFEADDHRHFNRNGAAFDVGETFAGVDFEAALRVVEALRSEVPPGATLSQWALRFILMQEAVSCVIPGAKSRAQVTENLGALRLPPLTEESMARVRNQYWEELAPAVHQRW